MSEVDAHELLDINHPYAISPQHSPNNKTGGSKELGPLSPTSDNHPFYSTINSETAAKASFANKEGTNTKNPNEIDNMAKKKFYTCGNEVRNDLRDIGKRVRTTMISALSLSSMALGIAALAEPAGEPDVPGRTMKNVESLYQAVTVITGVTVLLIVEYYIFDYRMRRQDCKTMKIDQKPFWGPNCIPLLVEILVHLPHPIPTHGWEEYSLYFTSAMFARVYTGLRVIAYNHAAYPMRFDVFGPKVDKYPTVRVWWATMVKITFLQHSGTFFLFVFWYVLLWASFTVYIAERNSFSIDDNGTFQQFSTCMWFVFVTMSTIGYGDMTPWTTLGKLSAVGAGLLGVVLANMIAAILAVKFNASPAESEIMNHLMKTNNRNDLDRETSRMIYLSVRIFVHKYGKQAKFKLENVEATRMELVTCVQNAKKARQVLASLVTDDAVLATAVSDIQTKIRTLQDDTRKEIKTISTFQSSVNRKFTTISDSFHAATKDLAAKHKVTADRLDSIEFKLMECTGMMKDVRTTVEDLLTSQNRLLAAFISKNSNNSGAGQFQRQPTPPPANISVPQPPLSIPELTQSHVCAINVILKKVIDRQVELAGKFSVDQTGL